MQFFSDVQIVYTCPLFGKNYLQRKPKGTYLEPAMMMMMMMMMMMILQRKFLEPRTANRVNYGERRCGHPKQIWLRFAKTTAFALV